MTTPISSRNQPSEPGDRTAAERTITNTRLLPYAPAAVYGAFQDPKRLVQWWGPHGFTSTIHEFDLRPGGKWRLTLHGPDGAHFENEKVFRIVAPNECVVFDHLQPQHDFTMTMSLVPVGAETSVTWTMVFQSLEEATKLRPFITAANEENLDRLNTHLTQTA